MEQLDTILAGHPPFDALTNEELRDLLSDAVVTELPAGAMALVEDGSPAAGLWTLLTGSMDLVHEGEVVQILEPGECFGQTSFLTGMAPAFSVRAREPSRCVVLTREAARRLLGSVAGAAFVAESMRQRLTRTGHTLHALRDVGSTPVAAIMRPATFVDAGETVADAARRLSEAGVEALLIRAGDELAIVSDADVRGHVAQRGFSADAPVVAVARSPVPTVSSSQLAIDAAIDMVAADAQHVAVVDGGQICGLLSAADLIGLDARSPIGLRHRMLNAGDEAALVEAVARLPQQFLTLARAGVSSGGLGRVLSLAQDTVVARLIDFSIWGAGPAPVPWAWLDLGSAARREFTLASDQDNALAYGRAAEVGEPAVDGYFERLATDVNDGLARCGIGSDNNGVMAGNRRWRMSKAQWLTTFEECLTQPDESHLVRATVAFDFRSAAGGLAVAADLSAKVRRARDHPQFMRLVARSAAGSPVALNFRGQLATENNGERTGRLDIKRHAIIPLVNLVRYHALAAGITVSPTLDRIQAIAGAGGLPPDDADALHEAFEVITRIRFEHHAALVADAQPADNLVDPHALAPIARTDLRAALQAVRRAQRRLPV